MPGPPSCPAEFRSPSRRRRAAFFCVALTLAIPARRLCRSLGTENRGVLFQALGPDRHLPRGVRRSRHARPALRGHGGALRLQPRRLSRVRHRRRLDPRRLRPVQAAHRRTHSRRRHRPRVEPPPWGPRAAPAAPAPAAAPGDFGRRGRQDPPRVPRPSRYAGAGRHRQDRYRPPPAGWALVPSRPGVRHRGAGVSPAGRRLRQRDLLQHRNRCELRASAAESPPRRGAHPGRVRRFRTGGPDRRPGHP